jgi:hypothetical protein
LPGVFLIVPIPSAGNPHVFRRLRGRLDFHDERRRGLLNDGVLRRIGGLRVHRCLRLLLLRLGLLNDNLILP